MAEDKTVEEEKDLEVETEKLRLNRKLGVASPYHPDRFKSSIDEYRDAGLLAYNETDRRY